MNKWLIITSEGKPKHLIINKNVTWIGDLVGGTPWSFISAQKR
jgi:hypothetical protein